MSEALQQLLNAGLAGAVAVLAIIFAWRKDREAKAATERVIVIQKDHADKMAELNKDHKAQMVAFEERYVTKAETWMSKYHELAEAAITVTDAVERRFGK